MVVSRHLNQSIQNSGKNQNLLDFFEWEEMVLPELISFLHKKFQDGNKNLANDITQIEEDNQINANNQLPVSTDKTNALV